MAAGSGAMTPINNLLLWGGFVVLNVVSILWAISMLGLQPVVVSLSYVAGRALAYFGVREMGSEISAAEITTAGATYVAFGALAVGNATAKVRLAFFNKGQVPFIFILIGLLVLDGVLNSQVSRAGMPVLLNAVLLPFIGAGVVVGSVWSVMNRLGIGKKPSEVLAERDAALLQIEAEPVSAAEKVVIPMPAHATSAAPVEEPVKKAEPMAPAAQAKPAPKAKPAPQPVVEPEPAVAAVEPVVEKKEDAFFPLEIDKEEAVAPVQAQPAEPVQKQDFEMPVFDAALYASGSQESDGGVMVQEPAVSVETQPVQPTVEEESPAPVKAEAKEEKPAKSAADDFLGGHLDLLNKLK